MVERRTVKLNMTPEEARTYRAPPGIDIMWLEWMPSQKAVIAEFVTSDVQPDPLLRRSAKDVTHELGTALKNRVIDGNMGHQHHLSPRRAYRIEAMLDHPLLQSAPREVKRNVEAATDVHDVLLTKEQVESMAGGKRGARPEPKETRTIRTEGINSTYEQEVYVFSFGEIDSG